MKEIIKNSKNLVSSSTRSLNSGRILLADDERSIMKIVSRYLKLKGFDVALADDGREALNSFIDGAFDLVVTDFNMPVMDGLSLAIHIKKRSPGTPVILMTGSNSENVLKKVDTKPFYSVIFKPFRLEEFQNTIQKALMTI